MGELIFRYGVMGASKSAQALIAKFNYEERGHVVWLIKPAVALRDGEHTVRSRIGLESEATPVGRDDNICLLFDAWLKEHRAPPGKRQIIMADESQFFSREHIRQLRGLTTRDGVTVICYGLRNDFPVGLFEGSAALFSMADALEEIPSVCECGKKAVLSARMNGDEIVNYPVPAGQGIFAKYLPMCWACYQRRINK